MTPKSPTVDNRLDNNKFDGVGNPDQGENTPLDLNLTPNQFPHQTGTDSFGDVDELLGT